MNPERGRPDTRCRPTTRGRTRRPDRRGGAISGDIPSLSRWARTVEPEDFRFADVDAYVLKQRPDLLRALGRERLTDRKTSYRDWVRIVLTFLVGFAPVGGLTAFGGTVTNNGVTTTFDGFSGGRAVDVAMWCFIVAIPGPITVGYRWWSRKRRWRGAEVAYLAGVVVCAALTLSSLAGREAVDVFAFPPPALPVWLAAVSAALVLVLTWVSSRGRLRVAPVEYFPVVGTPDPALIDRLVAALTEDDRVRLLRARGRALKTLAERGVIDESQRESARATPLGMTHTLDGDPSRYGG